MATVRPRSKLVTFEAQMRVDRAWRTVAIFDQRPEAVSEAERILAARRTPAVRVIQVLFDPETSGYTEYTVFRATSFDDENQPARRRVPDQEMFEWGADGRRRETTARRDWPHWATALAVSLAVFAAALLFRWVH